MENLFLKIINMSITSSFVILFVILVRFLLRKAPKIYSYVLWAVPFLRLVIPFSFQSVLSLIPVGTDTIPLDIISSPNPQIQSGIKAVDGAISNFLPAPALGASVNPMQVWIFTGQVVWLLGIATLVIYSVFKTMKLSKALQFSKPMGENIYETNNFDTPFVFGTLRPKVYIPQSLSEKEKKHIIKHEKTHIKRFDHLIKLLAFIVVTIHWFNPFVWIAFYLMNKDMELSCDESVIKKLGNEVKKDYSKTLLSLSSPKRVVGGFPLAFGGKDIRGRITNVLNYKEPKFWVSLIVLAVVVVTAFALLSNPKEDTSSGIDISESITVEDYAWNFIKKSSRSFDTKETKIIDSEIIKLERLSTFENLLSSPIEVWSLEYKLKPDDISKVPMAGGITQENGWIINLREPVLAFLLEDNKISDLGHFFPDEIGIDTLAKLETTLRKRLEGLELLPNETYEGNHVVIKFTVSTGESWQLLLSQPVEQGNKGIWAVERWMDGNGVMYYAYPETEIKIRKYYLEQQQKYDNGENLSFGNPLEVGYEYIKKHLEQSNIKKEDLKIIDPATLKDFLDTPVSHYVGYLSKPSYGDNSVDIDSVELLGFKDEERLKNLGIDYAQLEKGYYIHNPHSYPYSLFLSQDTVYKILDWNDLPNHKKITKTEFMEFIEGENPYKDDYDLLFEVTTKDGYVTEIAEKYLS